MYAERHACIHLAVAEIGRKRNEVANCAPAPLRIRTVQGFEAHGLKLRIARGHKQEQRLAQNDENDTSMGEHIFQRVIAASDSVLAY